jgi:hypothetical protein
MARRPLLPALLLLPLVGCNVAFGVSERELDPKLAEVGVDSTAETGPDTTIEHDSNPDPTGKDTGPVSDDVPPVEAGPPPFKCGSELCFPGKEFCLTDKSACGSTPGTCEKCEPFPSD